MQLHAYSSRALSQQRRGAPARRRSRSIGSSSSAGGRPTPDSRTAPPARATPATCAKSESRPCDDLEAPAAEPHYRSGRRLALCFGAAALVSPALQGAARAETAETAAPPSPSAADTSPISATTNQPRPRVYLDVRVDGEPAGRIEIELLPEFAPVGAARFADLAEEKGGVGYKQSKWDGIFLERGYVRCAGAQSLSYSADGMSAIAGGGSTLDLERELDEQERRRAEATAAGAGTAEMGAGAAGAGAAGSAGVAAPALAHDRAGLVSLVVLEAQVRPVKERLVAVGGKLVTLASQAGEAPNGSAFCVTLGPAPALDRTNLIVGRLVPGSAGSAAVVAALAALPVNMPREGISKPFFEAGKAMGDSRAIVAENRFFRPLRRAIISGGGELQ